MTGKESNKVDPLQGIRVLEWGVFHAGPGAPAILGDLGAEVIKIEQPQVGDPTRHQKQFGETSFELPYGASLFFEASNRNKKSVTLDLSQERGREVAYRLVAKSDVFLTNFRKGIVEGMKMTYPILSRINPRLIYISISAYGSQGPDSERGGFDFQGQARSGFMFSMGEPDMPPLVLHFGVIDQATAIMVSHTILTSLLVRERFGIGQEVQVSILGSALFLQYINVLTALWLKKRIPRHQRSKTDPLRNYYQCQDGKWLFLGFPAHWEKDKWPFFCQALGVPELQSHPRFDTRQKRLQNSEEMVTMLDHIFAERPQQEWLNAFARYDLIACPVNDTLDLEHDPQIIENGYVIDFDHPMLGKVKIPGFPAHFSRSRAETRSAAPSLGEHTAEALQGIGGYSKDEVEQLRELRVI
mgnify:CR=1 FL=1